MNILTSSPKGLEAFSTHQSSNENANNKQGNFFGEDGFNFGDILDIVNPLQHIPIVGSIYRKITGDVIAPAMEVAGGALFGGPLGAAISIVKTAIQSQQKDDSPGPNSPGIDKNLDTINPATIANNQAKIINSNDYSLAENSKINKLSPLHAHINTSEKRPVYQPADGIINIAHQGTEHYTNVITSNKATGGNIDIVIGSAFGAG